jgi:DNA-binding response OmpR family regulator
MKADSVQPHILHVCTREHLRPLRDQVLRISGFVVDSAADTQEGLSLALARSYDMVLIDVESDSQVSTAEKLCGDIKKAQDEVLVAFACNWRVSIDSDCPDDIIRTEFNPEAFIAGVRQLMNSN